MQYINKDCFIQNQFLLDTKVNVNFCGVVRRKKDYILLILSFVSKDVSKRQVSEFDKKIKIR